MKRVAVLVGGAVLLAGVFLSVQLLLPVELRWRPLSRHWGLFLGPTLAAVGLSVVWLLRSWRTDAGARPSERAVLTAGLLLLVVPVLSIVLGQLLSLEPLLFSSVVLLVLAGPPGLVLALAVAARHVGGRPPGARGTPQGAVR